jgi:hypothetical protein
MPRVRKNLPHRRSTDGADWKPPDSLPSGPRRVLAGKPRIPRICWDNSFDCIVVKLHGNFEEIQGVDLTLTKVNIERHVLSR